MAPALTRDDDKVREVLFEALRGAEAPMMTASSESDDELVDEAQAFAPHVILDWDEIDFDNSNCDPRTSESLDWTWVAHLHWNCRVSTSRYLDSLLETAIVIPGDRSEITGNLISPNRTIRLNRAENISRPTQGAEKGSGLTLTFSVNKPLQR